MNGVRRGNAHFNMIRGNQIQGVALTFGLEEPIVEVYRPGQNPFGRPRLHNPMRMLTEKTQSQQCLRQVSTTGSGLCSLLRDFSPPCARRMF